MYEETIQKAVDFLIINQRADGSWSGPLSSRIRETYLVYQLSHMLGWQNFKTQSKRWLEHQKLVNRKGDEYLLNRGFLDLFERKTIDLIEPSLYEKIIVRKTLMIFSLALVNQSPYSVPIEYRNLNIIYKFLSNYLEVNDGYVKGWAFGEMLCCKAIIGTHLGIPTAKDVAAIKKLQDQPDSWFQNPATTAFSLIALKYSGAAFDFDNFKGFFKRSRQAEGGWTYCEIPLWDTGLSLESLSLITKPTEKVQKASSKALAYLAKHQNKNGGWGFHEGLESEADTTSIILHSLEKSTDDIVSKATNYYAKLQFVEGDFAGLWPVWRQSEEPSVEVVAHITSALQKQNTKIKVEKAISWLNKQVTRKSWLAEWGRNYAYSINALCQVEGVAKGPLLEHLTKTQNSDGGWGAAPGEKSNASATANGILALKSNDTYAKVVNQALNYLADQQLPNGTWARVAEVIGPRPFVYADDCSTHNFVLQALLS